MLFLWMIGTVLSAQRIGPVMVALVQKKGLYQMQLFPGGAEKEGQELLVGQLGLPGQEGPYWLQV